MPRHRDERGVFLFFCISSYRLVQLKSGTVITTVNQPVDSSNPDTAFRWDSVDQQWIFNISTGELAPNEFERRLPPSTSTEKVA